MSKKSAFFLAGIILIIVIISVGVFYYTKNQNQGGENALRQLNNESSENVKEKEVEQITSAIDTSDWKTYDAYSEGVKQDVLGYFKYPIDWFTYNFAGGNVVEIYFSDGGNIENDNFSREEIKSSLAATETNNGKVGVYRSNECKLSIFFDGSNQVYKLKEYNTKEKNREMIQCSKILLKLKNQLNSK